MPYANPASGGRYRPVITNGAVQPSLSGGTIEENAGRHAGRLRRRRHARPHPRAHRAPDRNRERRPHARHRARGSYYAGLADSPDHNVDVELDGTPHPAATAAAAATGASARIMAAAPQVRMLQQVEAAAAGRSWIEGYFIPRGFTIVYADSLGTAGSDGCPTILTRDESVAMASVIRWLGRDATAKDANGKTVVANWSTGHVGMYGVSYDGTLPKMVASLRTRGPDAIVPVAGLTNMYGYYRSGGLERAPEGYQGEDVDVYIKALLTNAHPERCTHLIDEALQQEDRKTGDYSPFWAARDIPTAYAVAPALVAQGLTDDNVRVDQSTLWHLAMRRQGVPTQRGCIA